MEQREKKYYAVKAYGGKSALSFELDEGKDGDQRISVQGAPAVGPQQYDWAKKLVVQLSDVECVKLLAVLIGALPKFVADQHGPQKDKSFSIEAQNGKFFVKIGQIGNGMFAVPIEAADAVKVASIVVRQCIENEPWLTPTALLEVVRGVYGSAQPAPRVQAAPAAPQADDAPPTSQADENPASPEAPATASVLGLSSMFPASEKQLALLTRLGVEITDDIRSSSRKASDAIKAANEAKARTVSV